MKIFEKESSSWDSKVNFVDDNDVFVGYDTGILGNEDAGWFITDRIDTDLSETYNVPDVEAYCFDPHFFLTVYTRELREGGMVVLRLIAEGKPDLYLHLYNADDGCYSHGFSVKHGGEEVEYGCL